MLFCVDRKLYKYGKYNQLFFVLSFCQVVPLNTNKQGNKIQQRRLSETEMGMKLLFEQSFEILILALAH